MAWPEFERVPCQLNVVKAGSFATDWHATASYCVPRRIDSTTRIRSRPKPKQK